jgi:hypothetical protein
LSEAHRDQHWKLQWNVDESEVSDGESLGVQHTEEIEGSVVRERRIQGGRYCNREQDENKENRHRAFKRLGWPDAP